MSQASTNDPPPPVVGYTAQRLIVEVEALTGATPGVRGPGRLPNH